MQDGGLVHIQAPDGHGIRIDAIVGIWAVLVDHSHVVAVTQEVERQEYDVILGPVAPTTALKLGESLSDPIQMYLGDIYTVSVNLAGLPGISVPCGEDKDGLPVGLQILGQTFDEKKIIRAAYSFEKYRLENMSLKCDDIVGATAGKEA